MNPRGLHRRSAKPLGRSTQRNIAIIVGVLLPILGMYIWGADGFCYERHNGTYCYKGLNKDLLALCPFIAFVALITRAIEVKTGKTIRLLHANFSAFILFLVFPVVSVAMLLAGPNVQ